MDDNWKWDDLLSESSSYRKSEKESNYIDSLVDALMYVTEKEELTSVENKFHCKINLNIEKHNVLQFDYYYAITSKLVNAKLFLNIESGIDRGTVLTDYSFENNCEPKKRTYSVLKDVVLDTNCYMNDFNKRKAQAILDRDKNLIFEHERKNNYDNYVTGGNSKLKPKGLWTELHLKYIYEEVEADVNWM